MLIDMHAHSAGISQCCRADIARVIADAKTVGVDGIVLTNHYTVGYLKEGESPKNLAERYMAEYHMAKQMGEKERFPVFFGIEVTMEKHDGVHLLVYGVKEDFLLRYPEAYDMTQQELYDAVHADGGVMVQAHPIRRGKNVLLELNYLDGVEANSHPLYDATHVEKLTKIAQSKALILTSGGDFHADTHRPHCGAYLPDSIGNTKELCDYLLTAESLDIRIQEPGEMQSRRVTYVRRPAL